MTTRRCARPSSRCRQTGLKVLVCPEDRSQMAVGKEMLYEPLPEDVKKKVVWRETSG
jgi:hypothetical protein